MTNHTRPKGLPKQPSGNAANIVIKLTRGIYVNKNNKSFCIVDSKELARALDERYELGKRDGFIEGKKYGEVPF